MLSAALEKANCRNADLSDLYEEERKKNKMIFPSPDTVNQQKVVKTDYDVAAAVSNGGTWMHFVAAYFCLISLFSASDLKKIGITTG